MTLFIEGDLPTMIGDCEYHCFPTCHPLRGDELGHYGCLHKAWPANRAGDLVPLVKCDGERTRCVIPDKLINRMLYGRLRRAANAINKAREYEAEAEELRALLREKHFAGVVL